MKQCTFFVTDMDKLNEIVDKVSESAQYKHAGDVLLIAYSNFMDKEEVTEWVTVIKRGLPRIKVAGISVITSTDRWDKRGLTLSFCFFEDSKVDVYAYKYSEYDENAVINDFSGILERTSQARAVFFFPGNVFRDATKVLERITQDHKNICFFGALASSGIKNLGEEGIIPDFEEAFNISPDNDHINPFYIADEPESDGFLFAVISGKRLQMTAKYILGWNPLGKDMYVTGRRNDSIGNACITEIDNRPAIEIYKKYLGVEPDGFFMANVCEFPFTLRRGKSVIARVPITFGKDGELFFSGDIRDEEPIRLSYANPFEMLRSSEKASLELAEFEPEALFLIVCTNRFQFLRDKEKDELELFTGISPDTALCYGGYEVFKMDDYGGILNSALVAVGFKEADEIGEIEPVEMAGEPHVQRDRAIPIYQRLITFIDASTRDLEEALQAAEQASKSKSAFLSNMSHEIRTPINAVLGMDEMILREAEDENILKYAEAIRSAGNNLLGIVNDILDFSKIESGKLEIVPVEYEVASVLNDLINMVRKRAEDKGLTLIVKMDPRIPHLLYGDEIRIKQVVTNILTNAVKYTEKGSITLEIECKACSDEDVILLGFSVKDTGIGIKEEDLPKLFEAFERIEERRNRTIEGTGLGMNITQNLLRMMGSELKVESVYEEGSTFSFELSQKIVDDTPIGDFEDALKRSIAARKKYHESFTAPKARILVVDDTVMNLTVIEGLLKRTRLQIDTATSGQECLEKLRKGGYHMVFLDYRMPDMDGVETLKRIKEEKLLEDGEVPVIALTANAVSGAREFYLSNGFSDYISKPIDPVTLETIILSYLLPMGLAIVSDESAEDETEAYSEENGALNELYGIDGLDVQTGIKNCGTAENYLKALESYVLAAGDNQSQIREYFESGDIDNYTVKVHALKSSSRIIGAIELGALAEELESAGNDRNLELIKGNTTALLTRYKDLVDKIHLPGLDSADETDDREEISIEKLKEAYSAINEIAQMYDYDSLIAVMKSIDKYRIPESQRESFERLKKAIRGADWDEIDSISKEQESL